jgi:methylenetetrahydrofolate reductase (NADPH)
LLQCYDKDHTVRISEILEAQSPFISLEFFPPKEKAEWPAFFSVAERLRQINPLFASVTYGAGGSTQSHTLEIVTRLKREAGMEPMAHLTCIGASKEGISGFLDSLADADVDNVLALRGDPPPGSSFDPAAAPFGYASDLVTYIRKTHPQFGVAVAGYPEGHPEAESAAADLMHLKLKQQLGGEFIITQLFFDNSFYWDFVERAREVGVTAPIIPGILPIFSLKSIKRIISLCHTTIPAPFLSALEDADARGGNDAVQELGIDFARKQAQELIDRGAPGIHLYTLNRDEACIKLVKNLRL